MMRRGSLEGIRRGASAILLVGLVAGCGSTTRVTARERHHRQTQTPSTRWHSSTTTSSTSTPSTVPVTSASMPASTPPPTAASTMTMAPTSQGPQAPMQPATLSGQWSPVVAGANGSPLVEAVHLTAGGSSFVAVRIAARTHLRQYRSGAISGQDRGVALVAFNGGFNPSGYGSQSGFLGGPGALAPGLGAVVGYTDGTFGLGQWGRDVPEPGKAVAWAHSNLELIVDGGRPSPAVGDSARWGQWLHSVGPATARSALGIDGAGNLIYVASMSSVPSSLADALVAAGAVRAMILDMNPWWVCAFAYAPGATVNLVGNPNRPTDVFSSGWDRDFFVATR